jgi:hypothetical protein
MECDICQLKWSTENIIPLILPCGHTFCQSCIIKQIHKKPKQTFKCPTCHKEINSLESKKDVLLLRKNSALLTLTDKVQTYKTNNISNVSMTSQNLNFSNINQDIYNSRINTNNERNNLYSNNNNNNEEFYQKGEFYFPVCQTHKNKANFYNIIDGVKNFYCNECIQTNNFEELKPLPFLKTQNEFKINSCKNKIKILRKEICRVENFLITYQNNFEINNEKKIDELFDYINKIIQYNYTTAKTLFQQCLKEQKNQIDKKTSELQFLYKELESFEKKLDNIIKNNKDKDTQDPESQITLDNVHSKLSNFINYENELNLFQMNISIKEEDKDTLFNIIQNIYQIDVDFLKMKNGELPTIKELLNKTSTWPCDCGILDNSVGKIICKGCSKYRPLETYRNLVFNPLFSEKNEIKEFNLRRKHEEKVFQSLSVRNMDDLKHAYFFAIDISWYNKWRSFIYNDDKTSKYLENYKKYISENKKIGILPPGIIDNCKICVANKEKQKGCYVYKLKPGLILDKDYCIINQYLWEWFLLNYGGGPEIQLSENSIKKSLKNNSNSNSNFTLGEEDCKKKQSGIVNVKGHIINKNKEENKEQDLEESASNIEIKDKKNKFKISLENGEEIKKLNKYYNSKLTDIKPPKKQNEEDKPFEPEEKQSIIKSLISDINI